MRAGEAITRAWTAGCRAVVLDLDGTLVDSADAVLRGWRRWAEGTGASVDLLAKVVHGRGAAETIGILLPHLSADEIRDHVADVLRIQEIDPEPAQPAPGAAALVRSLAGHPWAVVTGCSRGMAAVRLTAGRLPRPAVLVTDEDVRMGKPDPEGYLLALRRLGIGAGDAVAVEDAPAGVRAAKAAGLRTIAVTTTHPRESLTLSDVIVPRLDRIRVSTVAGLELRVDFGRTWCQ